MNSLFSNFDLSVEAKPKVSPAELIKKAVPATAPVAPQTVPAYTAPAAPQYQAPVNTANAAIPNAETPVTANPVRNFSGFSF